MPIPLSRWVWGAGWILAFIAGIINIVGLLSFDHQAVTHMTGATSMLAAAVVATDISRIGHLLSVILAFWVGAVVSGVISRNSAFKLGRRYGVVLAMESLVLVSTVWLLDGGSALGIYTASFAAGLQNGMVTTFSGAAIRTTHVTGMVTDLGVMFGHYLQGIRPNGVEKTRVQASLVVISAFFTGGLAGALCYRSIGHATLYIPAVMTMSAALAYTTYWLRARQLARA